MNLIRIQTPYHEEIPRSYTSMTYQASFYDNPIIEHPPRPQTDFKEDSSQNIQQELLSVKSSLEKMLQEKIRTQKKDIEEIGERLIALEVGNQDLDRFKEDTKSTLNNIEKKCLAEIKRIENSGKGFVTQEDLKISTESLKNAHMNQLKQLEIEIQQIRSGDLDIKEEAFRITEEKVREMSKKFVTVQEFTGITDNLYRESEKKLRDFEINLNEKIENFRLEDERQSMDFEQRLQEVSKKYDRQEEGIYKKFQELEKSFENANIKHNNEIKSLKSEIAEVQELINIEDIESDIASLKKQVAALPKNIPEPDLSNCASKADIKLLMEKIQESLSYKQNLDLKISEIEKKIIFLENQESGSDEIDIDLAPKQEFINKGGATFGKSEIQEDNPGLTKIFINDLGDSDSESHGYVSPHTSPMNQIPIGLIKNEEKKNNQFDFKKKTDLHIKNSELNMINEDPYIENKAGNADKDEIMFGKSNPQQNLVEKNKKNEEDIRRNEIIAEKNKKIEEERKRNEILAEKNRKIEEENKKRIEEANRKKIEEENRKKIEEENRKKIEEENRKKIEEENRKRIEEENKKKIEQENRKKIEEENRKKLEEENRKKIEEEYKKKVEEENKKKIEEENKRNELIAERNKKIEEDNKKNELSILMSKEATLAESKKGDVKHFPVESVKVDVKKVTEDPKQAMKSNLFQKDSQKYDLKDFSIDSDPNSSLDDEDDILITHKKNISDDSLPESKSKVTEVKKTPIQVLSQKQELIKSNIEVRRAEEVPVFQESKKLSPQLEPENKFLKGSDKKVIDIDDDFDIDIGLNRNSSKPIESKNIPNLKNKLQPVAKKEVPIEKNSDILAFIQEFSERFIDDEINYGCKAASVKSKPDPPNLKIPQNIKNMPFKKMLDSPSVSDDEILQSGSDFKSDFSGDIDLP